MASITSRRSPFLIFWFSSTAITETMPGMGAPIWPRMRRVGFEARRRFGFAAAVADGDFAGLSVEFEEDGAGAVRVRISYGEEADDDGLAGFELDTYLGLALHAVIKLLRLEARHIAPVVAILGVLHEDIGIHKVAEHLIVGRLAADLPLDDGGGVFEIHVGR